MLIYSFYQKYYYKKFEKLFNINMKGVTSQYFATISAAFLMASGAIVNIWTSPVLPQLLSKNSPIGITISKDEASLITSLLIIGSVFGNIILGPCIDFFGRRGTLLLASIPIFLCWFLIIFAQSVPVLYAARFIQGIFVAAPMVVAMLYIGEIADPKIRGQLTLICSIISDIGSVLTIVLGSVLSYKMLGFFGAAFPVIFFLFFFWMPESPYFYVKNGDYQKAEKCLRFFRETNDVSGELNTMKKMVEEDYNEKGSILDLFRVRRFRKGVYTVLGLKTLHQMCGITAINSYMKIIFEDSKTGLNSDVSSIISVSIGLPAVILASYSVDKFGRKPLYYIASLGTMSSLIIESTFFFVQSSGHLDETNPVISWLPTLGIFSFNIFKSFGITTLPALYLGELFPPQVKGYATSLALVYGSVLASLISWGFPGFSDKFGYGVSFLIFGVFCFGGFLFVKFLLPETKGRTLAEIQSKNRRNYV